jgi:excisionase family DNA binding protein
MANATLPAPTVTLEQAAVRLGYSRRWIEALIRQGKLTVIRPGRRCTLILVSSLEEWEDKNGQGE